MARFQYRAVMRTGQTSSGMIEAPDMPQAVTQLRRMGALPVTVTPVATARHPSSPKHSARNTAAATRIISELAVLLKAGLQIDRALALAIDNVEDPRIAIQFGDLLRDVREGVALSQAMAHQEALFGPVVIAMTEAGEANGRLAEALAGLAEMMEQSAELRRLVGAALIYPVMLLIVALGVILLMLLFVIPQFESLFATASAPLPPASRFVMGASRFVRQDGVILLGVLVAGVFAARQMLATPSWRRAFDRLILRLPSVGELVRRIETARFTRTLGASIEGNVPLPNALALAQRTITNSVMADAVARVAIGVRQGGGLSAPLASAAILPKLAIGFFRTGEESSQLGPMLLRLSDVLDRDIKIRLERTIAILTPLITITLGMTVAGIIASVMSAILGFNDLAVSP